MKPKLVILVRRAMNRRHWWVGRGFGRGFAAAALLWHRQSVSPLGGVVTFVVLTHSYSVRIHCLIGIEAYYAASMRPLPSWA